MVEGTLVDDRGRPCDPHPKSRRKQCPRIVRKRRESCPIATRAESEVQPQDDEPTAYDLWHTVSRGSRRPRESTCRDFLSIIVVRRRNNGVFSSPFALFCPNRTCLGLEILLRQLTGTMDLLSAFNYGLVVEASAGVSQQ